MDNSTRLTALQQDSLWAFALRFYALPDVEAAFLCLQDEEGVDVCELLFHSWLFIYGLEANPQALAIERRERSRWQTDITAVLRQLRQTLKCAALRAGEQSQIAELRNTIKKAELLAERENLQRWEAWGKEQPLATHAYALSRSQQDLAYWLKMQVVLPELHHEEYHSDVANMAVGNAWGTLASHLDRLIAAR